VDGNEGYRAAAPSLRRPGAGVDRPGECGCLSSLWKALCLPLQLYAQWCGLWGKKCLQPARRGCTDMLSGRCDRRANQDVAKQELLESRMLSCLCIVRFIIEMDSYCQFGRYMDCSCRVNCSYLGGFDPGWWHGEAAHIRRRA